MPNDCNGSYCFVQCSKGEQSLPVGHLGGTRGLVLLSVPELLLDLEREFPIYLLS